MAPSLSSSASVEVVIEADPNDDALEIDASHRSVADRSRSGELVDRAAELPEDDAQQMGEIETVCGLPGTVDSPAENKCRIKAVVSPDQISTADKRKLYKVIEVWSVDKR